MIKKFINFLRSIFCHKEETPVFMEVPAEHIIHIVPEKKEEPEPTIKVEVFETTDPTTVAVKLTQTCDEVYSKCIDTPVAESAPVVQEPKKKRSRKKKTETINA